MTANIPIREATSGDIVKLRSNNQGVVFGLAINKPAVIFTAQVNQLLATTDGIIEFEYDNAVGTFTDVLYGMSVYVGTTAGGRERGVFRIRKTPTVTKIYIGAAAAQIENDDYITVVNDFALWGRNAIMQGGVMNIDSEIIYAARTGSAMIRAAPMVAVIHRVDGTATFTPPSPALSASYDGTTISSWQYTATGAATTSNMTDGTGLASWTYTAAGQYRWMLTVTDSDGRVTTTHRWVIVDNVSPDFVISQEPQGDFSNGVWSFGVTMYEDATTADIADRALVSLYTEHEYHNGVETNIGKLEGYENIVCTGWIDGETIVRDVEQGTVAFTIASATYWMDKIQASAFGLESVNTTPTKWTQIQNMTPSKALAQILAWSSTASLIMDCFLPDDVTPIAILAQPSGSLLSQLNAAAANNIFANIANNNLGQLYIETDPQIMTSAQRAALVTVQTITTADYEGQLELERLTSTNNSIVELECNVYNGYKTRAVYSRAPGNTGLMFGGYDAPSNYAAVDQTECNRLAGCLLAIRNPQYDAFSVTIGQNRLIDIAPAQYCEISVATADTPRGIVIANQKIIPRNVQYKIEGGYYKTVLNFEFATSPRDGLPYYPPQPANNNVVPVEPEPSGFGDFPSPETDFPDVIPNPVVTPPDCKTSTDVTNAPANQFALTWSKPQLLGTGATEADRTASAWCPCAIRKSDSVYKTSIYISGYFQGVDNASVHVYGVKGGTRIITATCGVGLYGINATFAPAAAIVVDGFEIVLDAGTGFIAGDEIASGTVLATDETGYAFTTNVGSYYCVDEVGGAWTTVPDDGARHGLMISPIGALSDDTLFAESLVGTYFRKYYVAPDAAMRVLVNDASLPFTTNEGSMDYILRDATSAPRIANLNFCNLNNVCAA